MSNGETPMGTAPGEDLATQERGPWVAEVDEAIAYRLHVCGLTRPRPWWVAPAYARQDGALRRQAKRKAGRRPARGPAGELPCDPAWALQPSGPGGGPPEDQRASSGERAWFSARWALGDRAAAREGAARVVREARALGGEGAEGAERVSRLLGGAPIRVLASAVVAGAVAHAETRRCAVGLTAPGGLAVLAWLAARLTPHLGLPANLEPPLANLVAVHTAATLYLRVSDLDQAGTEALLKTAGRALLPARGDEDRARDEIWALAREVLDQPPGEVGRMASGWHRGRTDRLHRAWQRGFFVPRGLDAPTLIEALSGPPTTAAEGRGGPAGGLLDGLPDAPAEAS